MNDFFTLEKQLCFAVYETAGEFTKLYTSVLQPYGLTYPQYLVLLALWEQDNITVKELGEKLGLGTGTLTPMLTRMEGNGWLKKVRSTLDERKVLVHLQTKAHVQKRAITETVSKEIQSCKIELEEYEQLMSNLNNLQKKIRARS
jgi:MarR family transcriptional regulator, organic hydroperoxide resistance regulator